MKIGHESLRIGHETLKIGHESLRIRHGALRIGHETLRVGDETLRIWLISQLYRSAISRKQSKLHASQSLDRKDLIKTACITKLGPQRPDQNGMHHKAWTAKI